MNVHSLLGGEIRMPDGRPQPETAADARVEAILALARSAFVEKGLEGASMKDLARAAEMSAGNFYRYFPSKDALIEALVARDLDEAKERFAVVGEAEDPLAALRGAVRAQVEHHCGGSDPLWAEIAACAGRKPEVAELLGRMEDSVIDLVTRVIALVRQMPAEEARRRFDAHARMILLIIRGSALRGPSPKGSDEALNELVLLTFNRLIDDLLAAPAQGSPPAPAGLHQMPTDLQKGCAS
jgi:AcrR family transcriptional regulator